MVKIPFKGRRLPLEFSDIQVITGLGTPEPTQLKFAESGDTTVTSIGPSIMMGPAVKKENLIKNISWL